MSELYLVFACRAPSKPSGAKWGHCEAQQHRGNFDARERLCDTIFMALDKNDLKEIRTIVTEVVAGTVPGIVTVIVTKAIKKNNEAIAEMFEAQNEYIDQRFAEQDKRIDDKFTAQDERIGGRFVLERAEIRQIIQSELIDIKRQVKKLEELEIVDIQEALDEIAGLKNRLTNVEQL
ncbi:MAG: hypothetical protein WC654_07925, partial [Patescibacteria group bacterium]